MRYKFLSGKYIFSLLLFIFAAGVVSTFTFAADVITPPIFEPGTTCRNTGDPRLAAVCGVVRSAIPKEVSTTAGSGTHPNPPAEGVSVYMYECDKDSPTCKKDGSLTKPFSSTSSDKAGFYSITMRKIGNNQIRYLAFVCDEGLAGLYKVPSFKSFVLNTPLSCPESSTYVPAPDTFDPVVAGASLSCDLKRSDPNDTASPIAFEAEYSEPYKPMLEFNFQLGVENADSRYIKSGTVLNKLINFDLALNPPDVAPTKGGFYHADCVRIYAGTLYEKLCYHPTTGETLDSYESKLYSDPAFTVMNFLPNIPIKNSLLFFKDLTARQDIVGYTQNPTAKAQLGQTLFSNCKGSVYLRKVGEAENNSLPTCESFKDCNSALSTIEGSYQNRAYKAGPASNLANPAVLQKEKEAYLQPGTSVVETEVCTHAGKKIKISDIQPPESTCTPGFAGCDYLLDKTYWNPEFAFFYGIKGAPDKFGEEGETSNDTPYGKAANKVAFTKYEEKAGEPPMAGTYYTTQGRENQLTPLIGGITSTNLSLTQEVNGEPVPLSYVLQHPFMTQAARGIYDQGIIKIEDAGSNLIPFCENSNVNPEHGTNEEFTKADDETVLRNDLFRGNQDHYFKTFSLTPETRNKRTPTSGIYLTTAAKNRDQALATSDTPGVGKFDIYDSLLTVAHGKGSYAGLGDFIDAAWAAYSRYLFNDMGGSSKSYFDRVNTYDVTAGDLRDDLKVDFTLSEENFGEYFGLPDITDGNLTTDEWRGTSGVFGHSCYAFQDIPAGKRCYEDSRFGLSGDQITTVPTRTCRVESCAIVTAIAKTTCQVIGTSVVDDFTNSTTTEDCPSDIYNTDLDFHDAILQCAREKKDCYSGGWDTGCMGINVPTQQDCPSESAAFGSYYPGFDVPETLPLPASVSGACPGGGGWVRYLSPLNYSKNRSCVITIQDDKESAPGCNMQDAGPYTCAASLEKDSNFRTRQDLLRGKIDDGTTINIDSTKTINNEISKNLSHPGTDTTYSTLAFQSADTSVSPTASETINKQNNKNKDTPGFGGASPVYKMISAHPLDINYYTAGNPIQYHCDNIEKNWHSNSEAAKWECNLLNVPNPEVIDLYDDSLNYDNKCALEYTCDSAAGIGLSQTFRRIVGLAATRYNVPAASIVTYLSVIGKFDSSLYSHLFSPGGESYLIEASTPWYGKVSQCDDTNTAAIGPYDWIKTWFDKVNIGPDLEQLFPGRGATASRCNFLDATYAAAKNLQTPYGSCVTNWDAAGAAIKTMVFGENRVGQYADENNTLMWDAAKAVWEACYIEEGQSQEPPVVPQ